MDATALLENLTARGLRLIAEPPKLIAEPSALLTDADRAAIRQHKSELMSLLAPAGKARAPDDAVSTIVGAPPALPLDLEMLFAAVRAAPRAPFENVLAYAHIGEAAVDVSRLLADLPPEARNRALAMCADTGRLAAEAIYARDYFRAYHCSTVCLRGLGN